MKLNGTGEVDRHEVTEGLVSHATCSVSSRKPLKGCQHRVNNQICILDELLWLQ